MTVKNSKVASAMVVCAAMPWLVGCACKTGYACGKLRHTQTTMLTGDLIATPDLPPSAVPGECWAKVFTPPQVKTVSERICLKEASERVEIIAAQYEWVEEKVCVKEASTQLVEVPAEYETYEQTVLVEPGHTDWVREEAGRCTTPSGGKPIGDVFCLVSFPPVEKTVTAERLVRPASFREITIPAEFQTVRMQKLVKPASCQRVEIPAEFGTVERTVKVSDGRWEWQRVLCERTTSAQTYDRLKSALRDAGYTPGAGEELLDEADWSAIKKYQADHRLAIGALTYETLEHLGVLVP